MTRVFIDGSSGTTGLKIYDRLSQRDDIELITLSDDKRKDSASRKEAINAADIAFLCLPDAAAREAAGFADGNTAIIDTSTAHRTADGWVYGFAELKDQRERIAGAKRLANPGCHASGFIALVAPLVSEGLIASGTALTSFSVTGYSGGGKAMIADYEAEGRPAELDAPRQYGTAQAHKHLPEMVKVAGLGIAPVFCPIVSDFYSGMVVTVPVFKKDLRGKPEDVIALYKSIYNTPIVHYEPCPEGMIAGNRLAGRDDMEIYVSGNEDRILLISAFDNLGKGASGAAIQNMNIMLGVDETTGLIL